MFIVLKICIYFLRIFFYVTFKIRIYYIIKKLLFLNVLVYELIFKCLFLCKKDKRNKFVYDFNLISYYDISYFRVLCFFF